MPKDKKDRPVTLEDYKQVSDTFFSKYHFVAKELGEGAKAEDILSVMESLTGLVLKERMRESQSLGFYKQD
jgi:hypothetical protein